MGMTRRRFVLTTMAGAAAGAVGAPAYALRRRPSVNDEIRVAVIGFNSRGRDHIDAFSRMTGVRVVALCDADTNVLARGAKSLADKGIQVETFTDMRRIMDRRDIDAVTTATPNHWHALVAIWACQSGKDVYVEKPVSHNVWEGRQLVKAARKYDRIVQAGTQARSSPAIAEAIEWVRQGNIGAIKVARGLCYKPRKPIGRVAGEQPVPDGIDYDLWTGPAEMKPLMRKKLHYDWHWNFTTGNGDLGNQGIHQMDVCRWALGEKKLAPGVVSIGGRFGEKDDGDTPNTQVVCFGYSTPLIFEVRGFPRDLKAQGEKWDDSMDKYKGLSIGSIIECEGGHLAVSMDYGQAAAYDTAGKRIKEWKGNRDHYANFIDAVRSRKHTDLAADIEEGHISSALCHMGNISQRLAAPAFPFFRCADGTSGSADEAIRRCADHLLANGINPDSTMPICGPSLSLDPETERFTNSSEASAMLRRDYRAPFVVPDEV